MDLKLRMCHLLLMKLRGCHECFYFYCLVPLWIMCLSWCKALFLLKDKNTYEYRKLQFLPFLFLCQFCLLLGPFISSLRFWTKWINKLAWRIHLCTEREDRFKKSQPSCEYSLHSLLIIHYATPWQVVLDQHSWWEKELICNHQAHLKEQTSALAYWPLIYDHWPVMVLLSRSSSSSQGSLSVVLAAHWRGWSVASVAPGIQKTCRPRPSVSFHTVDILYATTASWLAQATQSERRQREEERVQSCFTNLSETLMLKPKKISNWRTLFSYENVTNDKCVHAVCNVYVVYCFSNASMVKTS